MLLWSMLACATPEVTVHAQSQERVVVERAQKAATELGYACQREGQGIWMCRKPALLMDQSLLLVVGASGPVTTSIRAEGPDAERFKTLLMETP